MTKNKKILILIILIVLIIAIILIRTLSKDTSNSNENAYVKPGFVDHSNDVISVLSSTESDFQENKGNVYSREDFYNTTALNFQVDGYFIEFITLEDISEYCTYYDSEGNEVSKISSPAVDITLPSEMNVGDYYLLRYYDTDEIYVYYYITELTDNGFETVELFLITEGEQVRDY